MRFLLLLLIFSNSLAAEKLARGVDKGGYTNVRAGQGLTFDVVAKVTSKDYFFCDPAKSDEWIKVTLHKWESGNQITGYIHKSRIEVIEDLSDDAQKEIIFSVLKKQKQLADRYVEYHTKYANELHHWHKKSDSVIFDHAVRELEDHSETTYTPVLNILENLFCKTNDVTLITHVIETIWSDRESANEVPSFALGDCFACDPQILSEQIRKISNKEQKQLIVSDIEWGLRNKFSVAEGKESSSPEYLKLIAELDKMRN
jgi:hypothetical protein